ncbi:MAG: c-type cytochrome [Betaproteobacteria bacterium]|nr:c-type cytochrome [Betaproteobacteria bacterium]
MRIFASGSSNAQPGRGLGWVRALAVVLLTLSASSRAAESFDQAAALAKLREKIAGSETKPAGEVFENIELLKRMPAERLLRMMEMGFAKSLGVKCDHCHDPDNWASDKKTEKKVARQMFRMVGEINGNQLKKIEGLQSKDPVVNCTTCHRGEKKPATELK